MSAPAWTEKVWREAESRQRSILEDLKRQAWGDEEYHREKVRADGEEQAREQRLREAIRQRRAAAQSTDESRELRRRLRHTGRPYT